MISLPRLGGDRSVGNDQGYALVATIACIMFFAVVALGVLTLTERVVVAGTSEVEAARASAAADAGVALALRRLLTTGPSGSPRLDGTPFVTSFDDARLEITLSDERGKVPLGLIDEQQLTALLEYAGLAGEPLSLARDSFLDWVDDDDAARSNGAERDYYRSKGLRPRNGEFLTLGELGRVRGFSPLMVEKIAQVATADFGNGSFETRFASPAAIKIMYPDGDAAFDEIIRAREARGQTTTFSFADATSRIGRPVTIAVTARHPSGARSVRSCIVELTGGERRPYVTRHCM